MSMHLGKLIVLLGLSLTGLNKVEALTCRQVTAIFTSKNVLDFTMKEFWRKKRGPHIDNENNGTRKAPEGFSLYRKTIFEGDHFVSLGLFRENFRAWAKKHSRSPIISGLISVWLEPRVNNNILDIHFDPKFSNPSFYKILIHAEGRDGFFEIKGEIDFKTPASNLTPEQLRDLLIDEHPLQGFDIELSRQKDRHRVKFHRNGFPKLKDSFIRKMTYSKKRSEELDDILSPLSFENPDLLNHFLSPISQRLLGAKTD